MFTSPSSVSQDLHSCFNPLSVEPPSPWPNHQTEIETPKTDQLYIHPLTKSPSLSPKSLEMCTESLGSETGSDILSDLEALSFHAIEKQSPCRVNPPKKQEARKKSKGRYDFPPPLTSISGSDAVQVRAHREDGRLVIKASTFSCCRNRFQVERGNGRLRLSLVRDRENEDELIENGRHDEEEVESEGEKVIYYRGEDNGRDDGGRIGCKINGGDWSRCNGDRSGGSKSSLPSLPFCVAIS